MKSLFKKFVLWRLKRMAVRRLKKFKGKIIAVTGSVGKTSTREAIYTVLNSQFKVKTSEKSMNTDFGVLLTILDVESGYSSATKWAWLLTKAFWHSFERDHSEILLLELGVDKKGDMDFLMSVVKPDIAVMTNIFPVHLAAGQFENLQEIFEEKCKLVSALKDHGIAILNIDNEFLENLAKTRPKRTVVTFGKSTEADFWASRINNTLEGVSFVMNHGEKKYEVASPVLGEYQIYTILPAIICGIKLGMSTHDVLHAVERYALPPGRMSIIAGKEGSTILDSSYNSSPEALKSALKVLKEVGADKRKVAVIGNMNELGKESAEMHRAIGRAVPNYVDLLITVGLDAALIAKTAGRNGLNEKMIFSFKSALDAADFFKEKVKKDDVILVKGSQNNVRLEIFVKELMQNPEDAKNLLVRQEKIWQAKL